MGYTFDCSKNPKYKLIATVDHGYGMGDYEFICGSMTKIISAKSIPDAIKIAEKYLKEL
jgi:hypothetical protein